MAKDKNPNGTATAERKVKRTECPITRQQFREIAKALKVAINGQEFMIGPREFSTGSMGWNLNEKATVIVGEGVPCKVQIGLNVTLVGSKDLPKE